MAMTGGGDLATSTSGCPPRNKVKLLCSHGGKILPRPSDGLLKYVGGETRVISISTDTTFSELMKRVTELTEGEMVLKYQLIPDDLDALVSVKSDEDIRHMFEEYDRSEKAGAPRLRTFLFPANPVLENQMVSIERYTLEQRYLDAINGIVRPAAASLKPTSTNPSSRSYSVSSACSSPSSPDSCSTDAVNQQNGPIYMQRVQSTPSLCSLNNQNQSKQHQNQHHYPQNYRQPNMYQSGKHSPDLHKAVPPERRLNTIRSLGQVEGPKYQLDIATYYCHSSTRSNHWNACCNGCKHFECDHNDRRLDKTAAIH